LLQRVLHLRGALRASSFVLRSRNADPLGRDFETKGRMSHAARAVALAALTLAGCDRPAARASYTVADSAGIRVVSVETTAVPDTLRVSGAPVWSTEFVEVGEVHYLSGDGVHTSDVGRVVVGESGGFIWLGDPVSGEWTSIARPGDGPAEVGRLSAVRYHDGSIWAADGGRDRLLEFDLEGELLSEVRIPAADLVSGDWAPARNGHLFWGSGPGWAPSDQVIQRPDAPVVRVSDESIDTLFSGPNVEWFSTDWGTGAPLLRPSGFLTGADGVAWIGDSAESEIHRWSDSITTIVRWTVPDWEPRALADSLLDTALAALPAGQIPPHIEEQLRSVPLSPNPSKFDALVRREGGGVVVSPRWATCCDQIRRPAGAWLAIAADGLPDHLVALPSGFEPSFFGGDYVLGVGRDELGREAIQRWDLVGRE